MIGALRVATFAVRLRGPEPVDQGRWAKRPVAAEPPHHIRTPAMAGAVSSQPARVSFAAKLGDPFLGDHLGEVGVHDSTTVADPAQDAIERIRYTET